MTPLNTILSDGPVGVGTITTPESLRLHLLYFTPRRTMRSSTQIGSEPAPSIRLDSSDNPRAVRRPASQAHASALYYHLIFNPEHPEHLSISRGSHRINQATVALY